MSPRGKNTPESHQVNVGPDAGDEIIVRYAGGDSITYPVTDGTVTVADADLEIFLALDEGYTLPEGNPSGTTQE